MKTKLRTSNDDPRSVSRNLLASPFNPVVNFAIEDPLLLTSHKAIQKEGLEYAKYFCGNSPISSKAPEFLKRKQDVEKTFSEKISKEKTIVLSPLEDALFCLSKSFLSTQKFFIPDSILSPFSKSQTKYFSHESLSSLKELLKTSSFDHLPIVYLPKISSCFGRLDFPLLKEIKNEHPFLLIVEDGYSFGCEGIDGFSKKSENDLIDILITHIPKSFGKMLSLISGPKEMLDTFMEYSFYESSLFPPAAYLGMLSKSLELIGSLGERRASLITLCATLHHMFEEKITITSPLITFHLSSSEEKTEFTKSLVDKGFLLPASSFNTHSRALSFHLNYQLKETSLHSLLEIKNSFAGQIILESI